MVNLRRTRWRAVIQVEFDTFDLPACESDTAERQASWLKRATERGDRDINCSSHVTALTSVERIA